MNCAGHRGQPCKLYSLGMAVAVPASGVGRREGGGAGLPEGLHAGGRQELPAVEPPPPRGTRARASGRC